MDPSKLSDADKELIKSLRKQMSGKDDKDWDINDWDGKLSEGDVKLLKQMNNAMGNKSNLSFLGEEEEYEWDGNLSDTDIENLAKEVIRGSFGSGEQRKEFLGDHYQEVQNKVNQLMSGYTSSNSAVGSTTVKDIPDDTVKAGSRAVGSVLSKSVEMNLNNKFKKK